jgi:hypothetical protein
MLSYEQERKLERILNLIQVPEDQEILSREFNERERDEKGRFVSKEMELESDFDDDHYKWVKTGPNTWELVPRFTFGEIITVSIVGIAIISAFTWL